MENMNLKELQGKAKELKVKNWWTLKKADLISELQKFEKPIMEEPKKKEIDIEDLVTLKDIIMELKIRGAKARRILRQNEASIERPYKRWEWHKEDHKDIINKVKDLLNSKSL